MKRKCVAGIKKLWLILIFAIVPVLTFAQTYDPGEPCDDSDPLDNSCPLDSWVYMAIFVVIAVIFTGIYLRKQAVKELQKAKEREEEAATGSVELSY